MRQLFSFFDVEIWATAGVDCWISRLWYCTGLNYSQKFDWHFPLPLFCTGVLRNSSTLRTCVSVGSVLFCFVLFCFNFTSWGNYAELLIGNRLLYRDMVLFHTLSFRFLPHDPYPFPSVRLQHRLYLLVCLDNHIKFLGRVYRVPISAIWVGLKININTILKCAINKETLPNGRVNPQC